MDDIINFANSVYTFKIFKEGEIVIFGGTNIGKDPKNGKKESVIY